MRRIETALILVALVILIFSACDDRNPVDSTIYSLSVSTDRDTLHVGSNINYCLIRAALTKDGEAIEGVQVHFSASMGEVLGNAPTNEFGIAETTYWYNGTLTGIATVTASYQGVEDIVRIHIVDENPYILEIWSVPDTLFLGSGTTSTDVYARLTDRDGMGLENETIAFETQNDYITPYATTNTNGYAIAVFIYSGNSAETVEITATYQQETAVNFIVIIEPAIILLNVWADPDTIYIGTTNNNSEIYAELTNGYGNPIAEATINFSTSLGSIFSFGVTNSYGIANSTFWYNERPDMIAVITASYMGITDNTTVTVLADQPQIVFLGAVPLIIYADNDPETYSVITARVVDNAGSPLEGLLVTFQTSIGYMMQPYEETNSNGYATSLLQDNGIYGLATVYVFCENDQSQIDVQILEVEPPGHK